MPKVIDIRNAKRQARRPAGQPGARSRWIEYERRKQAWITDHPDDVDYQRAMNRRQACKGAPMAKKVVIGNAELWLGDCLEIFP